MTDHRLVPSVRAVVTTLGNPAIAAGAITAALSLAVLELRMLTIRTESTSPRFATGEWILADLGTNLPTAILIGIALLAVGAVATADGRPWGTGLIAGAATAIAGAAALVLGLVERPVQAVRLSATLPSSETYTTTITRNAGAVAAGVLVVVALLTAAIAVTRTPRESSEMFDRRTALATSGLVVVAALGTLIPVGTASVIDNFDPSPGFPGVLLGARLLQIGLMVGVAAVGFRYRNEAGVAIAGAALSVPVWLTISALFGFGGAAVGLADRNPGVVSRATPNTVTVIGVIGAISMAATAVAVAQDRQARRVRAAIENSPR